MDLIQNPERGPSVTADLEARFHRLDVTYKEVNGTAIGTAIFIPKIASSSTTEPTPVPVLVHFHGGGLVTGANPEPFFLPDWVRDLAHSTPAILVSPAYRLAPESPAVDALSDLADFWAWLRGAADPLGAAVGSFFSNTASTTTGTSIKKVSPDLGRVATVGESAGGFLSLQSALLFPGQSDDRAAIRATIAQYPAIYSDLKGWNARPEGADPAQDEVVRAYLRGLEEAKKKQSGGGGVEVRVSSPWPDRVQLVFAALQNGWMRELFGEDPEGRMTLAYAIARAKEAGRVPPIWVIQGREDSLVAKAAADEMVERLRREVDGVQVKYTVCEGDHGFDGLAKLGDAWVAEGVEWVKRFWLEGRE